MSLLISDTMLIDPTLDDVMPMWTGASRSAYEPYGERDHDVDIADDAGADIDPWSASRPLRWPRFV